MVREGEALRRRVVAVGLRTRGARLPEELREAIIGYARERRRRGEGIHGIARSVGVSAESIRRWTTGRAHSATRAVVRVGALVPVVVRNEEKVVAADALTVTAPGGYRVEGLTVAAAAELLRRLA